MPDGGRPRRRVDRAALGALLVVQISFASFAVFGKIALRQVAPLTIAAMRALFGAVVLTVLARLLTEDPRLTRRETITVALLSLLGIVANQTLYIVGLSYTTATNAALILSAIPVFTLLLSWLARAERPSWRRAIGIVLALSGIVFLLKGAEVALGEKTLVGDLLIALNGFCYAAFLVGSRGMLRRMSSLGFTAAIFRWGVPPVLLLALPSLSRFDPRPLTPETWGSLAILLVMATAVAYALNSWALSRTDAPTTAVFAYVQPLVAGGLAFLLLGERPGPRVAIAAVLIFLGIALTLAPPPARSLQPSSERGRPIR